MTLASTGMEMENFKKQLKDIQKVQHYISLSDSNLKWAQKKGEDRKGKSQME